MKVNFFMEKKNGKGKEYFYKDQKLLFEGIFVNNRKSNALKLYKFM